MIEIHKCDPRTNGPLGGSISKLSGLTFLEYDEVLVASEATDERPGLHGCAGGYELRSKAAGSGVGGTCFAPPS
jgi:hypothetical protein